jgi:hypothetical protein
MHMATETHLPATAAARPRWPVLPLTGFVLAGLSYVVWALLGLLAPLLGLLAVVLCWVARRHRALAAQEQSAAYSILACWGLRLGVLHLVLFAGLALVRGSLVNTAA